MRDENQEEKDCLANSLRFFTAENSVRRKRLLFHFIYVAACTALWIFFYIRHIEVLRHSLFLSLFLGALWAGFSSSLLVHLRLRHLLPYLDIQAMQERYAVLGGNTKGKWFYPKIILGISIASLLLILLIVVMDRWEDGSAEYRGCRISQGKDGPNATGGCMVTCTPDATGKKGTLQWKHGTDDARYEGEMEACQREGKGVTEWFSESGKKTARCECQYHANVMSGKAVCETREDGGKKWQRYAGDFKNDLWDGNGVLETQKAAGKWKRCQGEFKEGYLDGKAVCEWRRDSEKKWSRCQGIFRDEKMEGAGECEWHEDAENTWRRYRGNFKNNLFDGKGTLDWYKNKTEWWARYTGGHKEGGRDGLGVYEWSNGTYFTGRVEQGDSKNGWAVAYHDTKSDKWWFGHGCESQSRFSDLQFAIIHRTGAEKSDVTIFPCGEDASECRKQLALMRDEKTAQNAAISKNGASVDRFGQGMSKQSSKD